MVSTFQYPLYPYSGVEPLGDNMLNVPLAPGSDGARFRDTVTRLWRPALDAFAPQAVYISAGFDAHREDPLAAMEVSAEGFFAMASIVRQVAEELCGGRLVFALEGGYAASGLAEGTSAVLEAVLRPARTAVAAVEMPPGSVLRHVVGEAVAVHGRRIAGLGAA
jgi:acetoin utilization deacetylase AcuC-like enzyme